MDTKSIWLLKASNDDIVPFVCGAASTEDIANKMAEDIKQQFDSLTIDVALYLTDAYCVNGKYHYCDTSLPEAQEPLASVRLIHMVNDETEPFLCAIATTDARCEDLIRKMKEFDCDSGDDDDEDEYPYEYHTRSIEMDSAYVNGQMQRYT